MPRRNQADAEAASRKASEAASTLAARKQEIRQEAEPVKEREVVEPLTQDKVDRMLGNRPSAQAMDEILAKRQPKEEEPKDAAPEVPAKETSGAEAAEVDSQKVESAPSVQVSVASPTDAAPEAPKMVKVKIDGEESEVSQADIDDYGGVRAYQIAKAAENRLQKTNDLLAEIRRGQAEAPTKQQVAPSQSDQQYIQERIEKVRFGTPEEAAQAQLEINTRLNKPVDHRAMAHQIEQQIANKQAVAKFREEFSDIANNPILWDAAVALENRKAAAWQKSGRPVDWLGEYRKIGNEVRSAFGRQSQPAQQTATPGTPSSAAKEEKKASAVVTLPTAATRAALPKEEKEPTPEEERSSWFKDTKKARGQG